MAIANVTDLPVTTVANILTGSVRVKRFDKL